MPCLRRSGFPPPRAGHARQALFVRHNPNRLIVSLAKLFNWMYLSCPSVLHFVLPFGPETSGSKERVHSEGEVDRSMIRGTKRSAKTCFCVQSIWIASQDESFSSGRSHYEPSPLTFLFSFHERPAWDYGIRHSARLCAKPFRFV